MRPPRLQVLEVNKYRPALMRRGRYLGEDWGAVSDIGKVYAGVKFTREEYLRVENNYIAAVHVMSEFAAVDTLVGHGLELWHTSSETLHEHGLDDVLDGSPPVENGEPLAGARLDNACRRILREAAWLELIVPNKFLLHFGWDLRMLFVLEPDPTPLSPRWRELGLFSYSGTRMPETAEAWLGPRWP